MMRRILATAVFGLSLSTAVMAGEVDKGAVIGGALGGGVGAGVGSKVGGTSGAIIGGAIGGATGAAIGSSTTKDKTVVKERVVEKEVKVVEVHEDRSGPPGHSKGKKKGWKKDHRDD